MTYIRCWYGMILAQGLAVVPCMFLLMSGAMRGMDPLLAVLMAVMLLAVGGLAQRFVGTHLGT